MRRLHDFLAGHSESYLAKITAGFLLSWLMYLALPFGFQAFAFCLAIVWLSILFIERAPLILGLGSFACFFAGAGTTGNSIFGIPNPDIPGQWAIAHLPQLLTSNWAGAGIRLACEVVIALLFWLSLRKLTQGPHKFKILFSFLPLVALCGAFDYFRLDKPLLGYWLLTAIAVWNRLLWGFLLLSCAGLELTRLPLRQIWILFPVWSFSIPLWQPLRVDLLAPGFASRASAMRLRTIYFSICCLVVLILDRWLFEYLFHQSPASLNLPNPFTSSAVTFLSKIPNVAMAWFVVIFAFLRVVVVIFGAYLAIPFLLLMNAGIPAISGWRSPHEAKSFHEFSSRILGFYVQLNMLVFYLPIAYALRRWELGRRMRSSLAVFLGTFLFAAIFHYLRFFHVAANVGFWEAAKVYCSTAIVYDLVMALVVGASVYWAEDRLRPDSNRIIHFARLAFFVLVYSLLLTLYYNPQSETISARIQIWKFLFTGIR